MRAILGVMSFLIGVYIVLGGALMLAFLFVFSEQGATREAALLFYTLLAFSITSRAMVALFTAFIVMYGYFYWRYGLRRFIVGMGLSVLATAVAIGLHQISDVAARTGWS